MHELQIANRDVRAQRTIGPENRMIKKTLVAHRSACVQVELATSRGTRNVQQAIPPGRTR